MKNSLARAVESYLIELLHTHRSLKGKTFRHHDEAAESEVNCIIVEAVKGEDLLEGPRGPNGQLRSSVEATIDYRSDAKTTPQQNDITVSAIKEAIVNAAGTKTVAQKAFGRLDLFNEKMTSERSVTKSLRKWRFVLPIEAGLK